MKQAGGSFYAEVPLRGGYVLTITCPGYPVTYMQLQVPKAVGRKFVFEQPVYIYQEMDKSLDEVTVKASRILMVVKGDTIEYNAAAFRMAEGSMLDNLVRALPGVKMDDYGKITVNGEFVSSLLVDGRNFFSGDPRVALKNLPAYTVNKIEVYRKSEKAAFAGGDLAGEEKKKAPLVMDVSLKREYAKGWISNFEAGGGTGTNQEAKRLWMARLFAMRYTNHSSLAFFAGSNNLNDEMGVGDKGEWEKTDVTEGEKKTHMAGFNFCLDPKYVPLKFSTDLRVQQQRRIGVFQENGEDFYANVTTFRNNRSQSLAKGTGFQWNGNLEWTMKHGYMRLDPTVSYQHRDGEEEAVYSTMQSSEETGIGQLYERRLYGSSSGKTWNMGTTLSGFVGLPGRSQMIDFSQRIEYNRVGQDLYAWDEVCYAAPGRDGYMEYRDKHTPLRDWSYWTKFLYQNYEMVRKGKFKLQLFFNYQFEQKSGSARQELLKYTDDGLTPSVDEGRIWLADAQNSYHTTIRNRKHTLEPYLWMVFGDFRFTLYPTLHAYNRRIEDVRSAISQEKRTDNFAFDPSFSYSWDHDAHHAELGGRVEHELPEMIYLLDVCENSDPLVVQRGNKDLKRTRKESAYCSYKVHIKRHAQLLNLRLETNRWHDKIGMAQLYDGSTGVTTFRPFNVDGNRAFSAKANYGLSAGKKGNWSMENELDFQWVRSVDYSSDRDNQEVLSHAVRNVILTEELRLDYRIEKVRVGVKGAFNWTVQHSEQNLFNRLKYGTQGYGLTFSSPLLWGIDFDTDLMVYKRHGFDNPTMNTTDWVWNASLMRGLGRRRQWIVKVIGFDILHQLSSIRRVINSQGHVETRYNTLPSYVTCNLFYRLDVKPKKRGIGEQ